MGCGVGLGLGEGEGDTDGTALWRGLVDGRGLNGRAGVGRVPAQPVGATVGGGGWTGLGEGDTSTGRLGAGRGGLAARDDPSWMAGANPTATIAANTMSASIWVRRSTRSQRGRAAHDMRGRPGAGVRVAQPYRMTPSRSNGVAWMPAESASCR